MASDNGWTTPVHETNFETDAGAVMVRVVARRKTGLVRIYMRFPDGSRLGLSVDSKHVLAARGTLHETIRKALDEAEKKTEEAEQPIPVAP
jgi:hypothetical protein